MKCNIRACRRVALCAFVEILEVRALLAVFNVNTLLDSTAVNLVTGADARGAISLRSAIMAANATSGTNTIVLPAPASFLDRHVLTIAGRDEDGAASGDLDIRGRLTIQGNGATVDAANIDRIFDVMGATNLTINDLNILDGEAPEGGAIYNRGRLTLNTVQIEGLAASAQVTQTKGGGIFNARSGVITANASLLTGNAVGRAGVDGFYDAIGNATPGTDGASAAGGALYNLGQVAWTGGSIQGQVQAGRGGDGSIGQSGADAIGLFSGTDGKPGANGGRGGSAQGGAIFNGSLATLQMTSGGIQGDALAGAGGNGGQGGDGGNAGYWGGGNAQGFWFPQTPGKGGNGGAAGNAYGGAIYNNGGAITLSRDSFNPFQINGRAMGFLGGHGGNGGMGGDGVEGPGGTFMNGGNGADGGSGASSGSAFGGSIYSVGGSLQLSGISVPGNLGNIGAFGGDQSAPGYGGLPGLAFAPNFPGFDGANGAGGRAEGGFLWVSGGSVNINNSVLDTVQAVGGSSSLARGGALAIVGGTVSIDHTNFVRNMATGGNTIANTRLGGAGYGGAIWMTNGSLNLSDSVISLSLATGGFGPIGTGSSGGLAAGGAISISGGTLSITNTTLSSNAVHGGEANSPTDVVSQLPVRGGNGGSAYGGALYAIGGSVSIANSTLSDNSARSSAGAFGSILSFIGSGGWALGGGIFATAASVTVDNSTIHGNSVDMFANGAQAGNVRGGGIYHAGTGAMAMNHVTVARNVAGSLGGASNALGAGIFNGSGPLSLHNTLIVLNVIGSLAVTSQNDVSGSVTSLGYNLVGVRNSTTNFTKPGDRSGSSSRPLDAKLGTLTDNGGPTLTCSLEVGSPAINTADLVPTLATDQRGISRQTNGRADIGAYEVLIVSAANKVKKA